MLKSCPRCGRIHDKKIDCRKCVNSKRERTDKDKFRSTIHWQRKVNEIRERDNHLCQVCMRNLYNTINVYTFNALEVHHAISLEDDFEKRLDNDNLITVCRYHHELAECNDIPIEAILDIIREQEAK